MSENLVMPTKPAGSGGSQPKKAAYSWVSIEALQPGKEVVVGRWTSQGEWVMAVGYRRKPRRGWTRTQIPEVTVRVPIVSFGKVLENFTHYLVVDPPPR